MSSKSEGCRAFDTFSRRITDHSGSRKIHENHNSKYMLRVIVAEFIKGFKTSITNRMHAYVTLVVDYVMIL